MVNILILGGNGFIGSHLVDALLRDNHHVRVMDKQYERFRKPLKKVEYVIAESVTKKIAQNILRDIDIVFYLIGTTVPSTSNREPLSDIEDNLIPTVRFLNTMLEARVKRIVYLSSGGAIYGDVPHLPIGEDSKIQPKSSYGIVKVTVEYYLWLYEKLYGIVPTILRPTSTYGPRQGNVGAQGVISTFLHNIYHNKPLSVWGDGNSVRDYLYVGDLIDLCVRVLHTAQSGVCNVGSAHGISINDLIGIISHIVGKEPEVHYDNQKFFDVAKIVLDIQNTTKDFGWKPCVSLEDGIARHWKWITENEGMS